jgi:hypothetical protein
VTDATISITICVSGWTSTVRPATDYTTPLKMEQITQLHLAGTVADYEEDHRMPLELGGDPKAPHNLSPEAHLSLGGQSEAKDKDENAFKDQVCSGQETLEQAQHRFVATWLEVWPNYRIAPFAGPSATPTAVAAPAPPASLTVQITISQYGSLAGITASGAVCSARARLPSGSYSKAQGLLAQPTADNAGNVSWSYGTTTLTTKGTGTHFVTCTFGGQTATSQAAFTV